MGKQRVPALVALVAHCSPCERYQYFHGKDVCCPALCFAFGMYVCIMYACMFVSLREAVAIAAHRDTALFPLLCADRLFEPEGVDAVDAPDTECAHVAEEEAGTFPHSLMVLAMSWLSWPL